MELQLTVGNTASITVEGENFFQNFLQKQRPSKMWRNSTDICYNSGGFPGGSVGKKSTCNARDLGWENPLEKEMATHSSIFAWRISWTEKPGGL